MSTDAAPLQAVAAAAPAQPLSKSQKKRMKQKASKARKEALEAERAKSGAASIPRAVAKPKTLNPHEKLRHDVRALGFTDEDVTKAMEEMWEMGLRYDDFDTVVSYLESKAVNQAVQDADLNAAMAASAEEATQSTAASTSTAGGPPIEEDAKAVPTISEEEGPDDVKLAAEEVAAASGSEPVSATTSAKSKGSRSAAKKAPAPAPAPVGLAAKLEMVSNFENMSDAVFALTEWVTKAAKPKEIVDFCDAQKCKALPTILRRAILEGTDSMGSVLDLIGAVLRGSGASPSSLSPVAKALGSAVVQARSVVTSDSAASSDVAEKMGAAVADMCVAALGRTIEKFKLATQDSDRAIRQIEEEIDALASALPAASAGKPGVVELMTRRDCHKVAAEKYSTVASIVVVSATADGGGKAKNWEGGVVTDGAGVDDKRAEVLALLLGDEYGAIVANRSEYESLKTRLDDARASTRVEREALISERDACRSRKEEIAVRMAELQLEMKTLEREGDEMVEKISEAEEKLEELDRDCDDAVRQMKEEIDEKAKIVKLEDDAHVVTEKLQVFEAALSRACSAVAAANVAEGSGNEKMSVEKMSNKMGIYFVRMRNYFKAEADCVEFLVSRSSSLSNELKELEREIEECKSLGMVTNVAQMIQTLKQTRRNIEDDKNVVQALRGEAEKMRDELVQRLGEFKSASVELGAEANKAFTSLQLSVITGIKDAMSRIGIDDGGLHRYLDCFVGEVVTAAASPARKENGGFLDSGGGMQEMISPDVSSLPDNDSGNDGSSAKGITGTVLPLQVSTVEEVPTQNVAPPAAKAVAPPPSPVQVPKFSWGAAASAAKKPEPVSLLEIQKQEQEQEQEQEQLAKREDDGES